MYWFASTCTVNLNTAKLPFLSKILKKSMVTKGLALILSLNIKPFTNNLLRLFQKINSILDKTQRDFSMFWQRFP